MTITRNKLMTAAAGAVLTLSAAAAHAEKKPTILLVHGAAQADADWQKLALGLAHEGYRVLMTGAGKNELDERARLDQMLANEDNSRLLVITSEPAGATVTDFAASQHARVKGVVYLTTAPTIATVAATPQYFVQLSAAKTPHIEKTDTSYSVHAAGPEMLASTSDLVDVIEAVDAKKSDSGTMHAKASVAATTKVAAHSALSLK